VIRFNDLSFTYADARAPVLTGVDQHHEGDPTCTTAWRWQEVVRLMFLRSLVDSGRLRDRTGG